MVVGPQSSLEQKHRATGSLDKVECEGPLGLSLQQNWGLTSHLPSLPGDLQAEADAAESSSIQTSFAGASFSNLPDDFRCAEYDSQSVSDASFPDTPLSLAGQNQDQALIPAVWRSEHCPILRSSRAEQLPRYMPQLNTQRSESGLPHQDASSPDDDAWLEFKQSILGSDWLHHTKGSSTKQAAWHQESSSFNSSDDANCGRQGGLVHQEDEDGIVDPSSWAALAKAAPERGPQTTVRIGNPEPPLSAFSYSAKVQTQRISNQTRTWFALATSYFVWSLR